MQQIALSQGRVEYRWSGPHRSGLRDAGLPVIVLLHEGLGCVAMWKDFPELLAQATGLPVLAYSRVGYGGSDPCILPRPLGYMHEEGERHLPELLSALGIQRHILVGHSDGASIALVYAGAAPPDGLLGVAVMAPHSFCEDVSVASIQAADRAYAETDLRVRLARYHGDNVDCAFRGWCDAWLHPDFRRWNIEAHVARIMVPVLVIQGEDDEYGTVAQVDSVADRVQGRVQTLLLPACGHSPHRDQPDATVSALQRFVGEFSLRG